MDLFRHMAPELWLALFVLSVSVVFVVAHILSE